MNKSDRIYFSNFSVDPEFESIFEYDQLYDLEFDEVPEQFGNEMTDDDTDEFMWDDV